jgi:hypothetical protein
MKARAFIIFLIVALLVATIYEVSLTQSTTPETTIGQSPPENHPASISFTVNFPQSLVPGVLSPGSISVANRGGDAWGIRAIVDLPVVAVSSNSINVTSKSSGVLNTSIVANDTQDGIYNANLLLTYSDDSGSHKTTSTTVSFHIIPLATLDHVTTWGDIWHQPTGKDTISGTDSANLFFDVVSRSHHVVYSDMTVKASWSVAGPGLTVTPQTQTLAPLGPQGKSTRYNVTINSSRAPPGTYVIMLSLYSASNDLMMQTPYTFTVKA